MPGSGIGPSTIGVLIDRSGALLEEFVRTGKVSTVDEAIAFSRGAVAAAPKDHPALHILLSLLVAALKMRFDHTGDLASLDEAVKVGKRAVALISADEDGPLTAGTLCLHAEALSAQAELTGDLGGLEKAVRLHRRAANADPESASVLSDLSNVLADWAERTGQLSAIKESIEVGRRAAELAPDDPGKLTNLGNKLHSWFQRTGDLEALNEAVELSRRALALGVSKRGLMMFNLANVLRDWSAHTGNPAELDEAISLFRQALASTPDGHPRQATRRSGLASALQDRFICAGDPVDLSEAISLERQALAATSETHPDRAACLARLGDALVLSSESSTDPVDPDEVVRLREAALSVTPTDHPDWAKRLSGFGDAFRFRFERVGDPSDLNKAVDLCAQALEQITPDHPDLDMCLFNAASAWRARFDHTGDLSALTRAIDTFRRAADLIPTGQPFKSIAFALLGAALRARFDRTGDLAALDQAVHVGQKAAHLDPGNSAVLNNLGNALQAHYEHSGDPASLQQARLVCRKAVESALDNHPNQGMYLANLVNTLHAWSAHYGDQDALREAVTAGERAVSLCADGHPHQALASFNLGVTLRTLFEVTADPEALQRCIAAFRTAANVETAPSLLRVKASGEWGRLAAKAGDWEAAYRGLSFAVQHLPSVAPRELDRSDQEHGLGQLAGLAAHAAACAMQVQQAERAVELLEQGRGILISQALETRTDVSELHSVTPDLAEQFQRIRDLLTTDATEATDALVRQRRDLLAQWKELLVQIRSLPGLEHFAAPPPIGRLLKQAGNGPIVLVNVSSFRSDAFILTTEGVHTVPLPGLTPQWVAEKVIRLYEILTEKQDMARAGMFSILSDLWDVITGPVLEGLGITSRPEGPWPRIWWSPTGVLSLLPLHAAGHHDQPDPCTVLDRVVSSYIPTVRALEHARSRPAVDSAGIVVTAMPNTPGATDLPGVLSETRTLQQRFPNACVLLGHNATRDHVLAQLAQHPIAHFACHANTVATSPSHSHLLLHDGRLTTMDISAQSLIRAKLAYLSACATTETHPALADEAIHITAAFQLAGYAHVIGTLWPIMDNVAPVFADLFYANLMSETDRAALALHHAVRQIRQDHPNAPLSWASHIHIGP